MPLTSLLAQPQFWALLVGVVVPLLVSVVNQPSFGPRTKHVAAVVVSALAGLATVGASGQLDTTDLVTTITLVYVASQTAYHQLWKRTGITDAVETATNLTPLADPAADSTGDSTVDSPAAPVPGSEPDLAVVAQAGPDAVPPSNEDPFA